MVRNDTIRVELKKKEFDLREKLELERMEREKEDHMLSSTKHRLELFDLCSKLLKEHNHKRVLEICPQLETLFPNHNKENDSNN